MRRGVIDIGNTRAKTAVFDEDGSILQKTNFPTAEECIVWLASFDVQFVLISSVAKHQVFDTPQFKIIYLNPESRLPFDNQYKSRETLGADRVAAMASAAVLFPGNAVLVFDIGTCMTIDFLQPDGVYKGGNISPGIRLRFEAMHQMTGRLPLADVSDKTELMGDSTKSALASGVLSGMTFEIQGYIDSYLQNYPELITVLCGGDHIHFDMPPKYKIFAATDFVLQGLYQLLLLNEK